MKEYIKREVLSKIMNDIAGDETCPMNIAADIYQAVDCIPAADIEPVRHGYWDDSFDGITPYCSVCRRTHMCINRTPSYCPNCGGKMDKEANND